MAKNPVLGWFHDPLSAVLGTRGKVAVLRVLAHSATPLVQREVARRAGMALRTIELAIDDLLETGVVERIPGGRERLVRIRSMHRLTPALVAMLRVGSDYWSAIRGELRTLATGHDDPALLSITIVGRAANRIERINDSLDLLVLTTDDASAERWGKRFLGLNDGLQERYGITLRPLIYTLDAAREMWEERTSAAEKSVAEGEWVHGEEVTVLLAQHAK